MYLEMYLAANSKIKPLNKHKVVQLQIKNEVIAILYMHIERGLYFL